MKEVEGKEDSYTKIQFYSWSPLEEASTTKLGAQRGFGFDYCKEGWTHCKVGPSGS
jgi:hypothetical protein